MIPLAAPDRGVRFATDPFFWWHQANAWAGTASALSASESYRRA